MAKITRYTGNLKAFAENSTGTKRTVFGDVAQSNTLDANITADFLKGWEIIDETTDFPTIQDFNAMGFTHGQLLAYLHQVGVPEWSGTQEYHVGSIVNRAGVLYVCKTNTHISATVPESDAANWKTEISIGFGQTWQDVTLSRANNVDYTNSTGQTIEVVVTIQTATGTESYALCGGVAVAFVANNDTSFATWIPVTFMVPPGAVYKIMLGGTAAISLWTELRQ